ncbi:MAG: flagellar biosynthetic protein FliP [Gammaproteobacteria bacterium]|nr:flagellar biosynthetic protein FliP [Gammaproteobacteria bacterium]|tara:strand:- start:1069 stop:1851 length:783 start_codon:yes stop_codon:yes gene_type:complete
MRRNHQPVSINVPRSLKVVLFGCVCFFVNSTLFAQTGLPLVNITEDPNGATEYSLTLQVLILMTVLTLLPSLLIMMTSFVRVIIVMSLLRQAIGTAQTPPNTVLVGIALFLTFFIMSPILETVYNDSIVPYIEEEVSAEQAIDIALVPIREFMVTQTREDDLMIFSDIGGYEYDGVADSIPLSILIPSFMTSELKTAFTIGFLIYIPFVIIDLVVASVLMSMGMMMLSPMMISMPFKLMLFVLADGWILIMQSLTSSFAL